ncbi:hypothetical protein CAL13_05815 [Bordetella genomosp. 9]|uniref:Uncharacterized protein n=2 Tax=Bordetella genomosp. 9 TaxID=1416803 RepID=A0A1W6YXH4_9BORD|nr:hypothetical protein CAL13_05815 [Bordetella genomosp. 9]
MVQLDLENRTAQLSSLLMLIHGQGCSAFNGLPEVQRDHVLWLASDLAEEIRLMVNGEGAER